MVTDGRYPCSVQGCAYATNKHWNLRRHVRQAHYATPSVPSSATSSANHLQPNDTREASSSQNLNQEPHYSVEQVRQGQQPSPLRHFEGR